MAIKLPPKPPEATQAAEAVDPAAMARFIAGAPDAGAAEEAPAKPARKGVKKGNKEQISHTISPDLLARLDEFAVNNELKRAQAINMAIVQLLERGAVIDGKPKRRSGE